MCTIPRGGNAARITKPGRHLILAGSFGNQFAVHEDDYPNSIMRDFKPVYAINVRSPALAFLCA